MSRYDALTDLLKSQSSDSLILSFDDLDEVVGDLPPSARRHPAWWANSASSAHQARYWLSAGWKAKPDFNKGSVHFRREKADLTTDRLPPKAVAVEAATKGSAFTDRAEIRTRRPVTLIPNGEMRRTTVMYEWQSAGHVSLLNERLALPVLEGRSGVYRFSITEAGGSRCYYVGETDNLSRRMNNYRHPGPTQPTNLRLNGRLLKVLGEGGSVTVEVVVAALSAGETLDLSHHSSRLVVENVELCELRSRGDVVENL